MSATIKEVFYVGNSCYVSLNKLFKKDFCLADSGYSRATHTSKRVYLSSDEDGAIYIWDTKKLKRFSRIQVLKKTKISDESELELAIRKQLQKEERNKTVSESMKAGMVGFLDSVNKIPRAK